MRLPGRIAILIQRVGRRRLVQRALWRGMRGLAVALGLVLLGAALADLFQAGAAVRIGAAGLAVAMVAAAVCSVWAARPKDLDLARLIDRRAGLKDALGSAVAFAALDDAPVLARLSVRRAEQAAGAIDPRRVIPYRVPRRAMWAALLLGSVAAAWVLIAPAARWRMARGGGPVRISRTALVGVQEGVERLLADARKEEEPVLAAAARDLDDLITRLQAGGLALEEALEKLGEVEVRLAAAGESAWFDRLAEALRRAGEALRGSTLTDQAGRRLQHGTTPEARDAMQRLADEVRQAGKAGDAAGDLAEAARRLQAAAEAVRDRAPDLAANLEDAARDLDAGRHDRAAQHIQRAARNLGDLDKRMKHLRMLKRAEGQIARLKDAVRAGVPPQNDQRWAVLMNEVPESLRRTALPTMRQGAAARGPSGIGTADTGPGAVGQPTRLDARRVPAHVPGRVGPEGEAVARIVRGVGARGASAVGYSQVFAQYAGQVEAALEGEDVPLGYRFYVRRYFEGIRPRLREDRPR